DPERGGLGKGIEEISYLTVLIHQVLMKIPQGGSLYLSILLFIAQELVKRMRVRTADDCFGKYGKRNTVIGLTEFHDLLPLPGLLPAKIVGGNGNDFKTPVAVLLIQLFEIPELADETAFGSCVYDEKDFPFEFRKANFLSVDFFYAEPEDSVVHYKTDNSDPFPPNGSLFLFPPPRSEEHTSELQSRENLVCRLL